MQPRTELILAATLVGVLGFGAAALGARHARTDDTDRRRSTFLAGPSGALGYAQAFERLGVHVERWRRPSGELRQLRGDSTVVAVLGPTAVLEVRDAQALVATPHDLLLAGRGAGTVFRCLGYEWRPDSLGGQAATDAGDDAEQGDFGFPAVRGILVARPTRIAVDSSHDDDGVTATCRGPAPLTVDTLRRAARDVVALRLTYPNGRAVVLVADDRLFTNRALRNTDAGPFALGLVVPRYRRVVVDEYHHGFAQSGSLAGALYEWSVRSPWGWAAWQLMLVGLVALLASGVRFGPIRQVVNRRRRSPLEHVRALATALGAARGHEVAVTLMVRGLRRRLSRTGHPGRGDPRAWLAGLDDVVRTADGRRALATLRELTGRPADARSVDAQRVQRAAHAVEDVWEELSKRS